ncbi:MAG: T9SS type A sorting domain-containing protein [Chlorobi bacterium]|nr:T9SS type A sorting domain-containing protein [Chlorobiota bacterium]
MFKNLLLSFAILSFAVQQSTAQLITVDPPFPVDQDEVVVTFDASLGSAGLAGYSGSVYAHTGVITNNSTSGTDWKYVKAGWNENIPSCKMTSLGNDLWELTIDPSIRDYYGVPSGEIILQLAFVFRSSDGSLTGKTESGGDIFYDLSEGGLAIQITLPETSPLIVQLNDNIYIEGSSSDADSTFLFNNDNLVYADTGSVFQYDLNVGENGTNWFKAVAKSGEMMVADSFSYYTRPEITIEDVPEGVVDGINYIDDNTVILCIYAPEKDYVFAIGDFSDWQVNDDNYMKRSSDGNRYWIQLNNLEAGKEYIYQYFIDGSIRVGDSYADKVSDPWNDKYIPSSNYPGLISYPEGKTSGIATVFQTAQTPYNWQINDFQSPDKEKLVVYELLMRDFTSGRTYEDLIDTLNYLDRLGVNAIELMPVNEFEGNNSWGYNPNYYFAVDKYYGPKNTFKQFIDEAHSRGIAVIMDLVLNHAYGTNPMVMMYWDSENNRPAANNPWFNTVSPNPVFAWGNDFNHESQDTKDFVDRVNKYWIQEYKIDGFRFDFTKGFTNTPGDGWNYDAARISILERMSDRIWETKQDAYVIMEHLSVNTEEKVLANHGIMLWGNMNYNYNEATMGYVNNSNFSGISYKSRGFSEPNLVGYMESHDEERLMYKNLQYGNSNGVDYDITQLNTALRRNEMAAAFFITVPGPKMIWQFGELGYDYSINTCEDGTINDNCRLSPKPVKWAYYNDLNRRRLFYVYQALIDLKENQAAFSTSDFTLTVNGAAKSMHLNNDDMDVTIIGNFDVKEGYVNPSFQTAGTWYDYFSGDSLIITNTSENIGLQAGEYHIYTTKRLQIPEFVGVNNLEDHSGNNINIYPNPASGNVNIDIANEGNFEASIKLYDMQGKVLKKFLTRENNFSLDTKYYNKGLYILNIEIGGNMISKKLLIN